MGVKWLQYITKCECCSCGLSLLSDRHWRGPSSDIGRLWLVPHPNFHGRKISMCSLQLLHGLVSVTPPLGVHPQTAARSLGLGVRTPSLGDASPSPSWRGVGWAGSSRGGAGGGRSALAFGWWNPTVYETGIPHGWVFGISWAPWQMEGSNPSQCTVCVERSPCPSVLDQSVSR